jgi:hypothetical protein
MVKSGGVINFVAPDEDGYVEIYVSTSLKYNTVFYTDYMYTARYTEGGGGGYNGGVMTELRKGDVTHNDSVSIYITDATLIQRYIAKRETFDELQTYKADADNNGVVDVMDATLIQRHIAKL